MADGVRSSNRVHAIFTNRKRLLADLGAGGARLAAIVGRILEGDYRVSLNRGKRSG